MLCSSISLPVSHCLRCSPSRQGFSLPPCQCSGSYSCQYPVPNPFISYPCIGLHLARERSTLRHYLLTGIRVTESCTPGLRPMPPSAILISHTYTNVPFFLFITCSSFKWSFELNLTLLEHCANTITKLWLLDTMQGFGSHAHHAHALFLKARLRNLRGYSSPSASRSGLLVKSIPARMRLKLEELDQ